MPRGIQDSSKRDFIKKRKIHQAQKGKGASRQERSLESASKRPKSIKLRKIRKEKCPQKFISPTKKEKRKEKKARQAENPKGRFRQKLGPKKKKKRKKKKKAHQAENPKWWSRQKLGPKKKRRRRRKKKIFGRSYQVGNLKMQPKKRIILQDESLEVWFKRNEHKNNC